MVAISLEDLGSLACSLVFYFVARAALGGGAAKWAVLGFVVCLQGWEFSWSCGVHLGGYPAFQEGPALSYSQRADPNSQYTRPDFLHACVTATFDGSCMALLAAVAARLGGSLTTMDLRTCAVMTTLGYVQNGLVTRYAHLNLNNLASAPLAPLPKCHADETSDEQDVCYANQSMWVLAPLLTYLLAISQPTSHAVRVGASAALLLALPLAACAQGPVDVIRGHPMDFASLVCILGLAAAAGGRGRMADASAKGVVEGGVSK